MRNENNGKTASWRDSINANFKHRHKRELHWRDFKHEQKVVIAKSISKLPIRIALAASHKTTIPGSRYQETFKKKGYLYNYLIRWQLERVISFVETLGPRDDERLGLSFSRRAGTDYESMKQYLMMLKHGLDIVKSPRSTNWDRLDFRRIRVENHSKSPGLQLADCITSSFFNGLEPNGYGYTEPRYGQILSNNLIRRDGTAENEGFTIVPSLGHARCNEDQKAFILGCSRRGGQAPGS